MRREICELVLEVFFELSECFLIISTMLISGVLRLKRK